MECGRVPTVDFPDALRTRAGEERGSSEVTEAVSCRSCPSALEKGV